MAIRDLSQPLASGITRYPGDPAVSIHSHADIESDGYRVSAIRMGSHSGTHVDAPSHTEPDGKTVDELPVDRFRFDAHLIDCSGLEPREAVDRSRLPDAPDVDLVLFRTGWDIHWTEDRYVDHPYLGSGVASWCRMHGYSVGVDCLNPDPTPSASASENEPSGVPVHRAVLGAGNLIIENLTNLSGLPEQFELHAMPLPIVSGDGAPVRALAVLED